MSHQGWLDTGPLLALLAALAVLASACGSHDRGQVMSCEDLDQEVDLVLCDDGDTRIDRRAQLAEPSHPEAERATP